MLFLVVVVVVPNAMVTAIVFLLTNIFTATYIR